MSSFKWTVRKYLSPLRLLNYWRLVATSRRGYLRRTGWNRSLLGGVPCDAQGRELPWMNYAFIAFIEERLRRDMRVLEYGAGYSTVFWSRHVHSVHAVEHSGFFSGLIADRLPPNAEVVLHTDADGVPYSRRGAEVAARHGGLRFDLVVIDGIHRVETAQASVELLTDDGVLVWDDAARPAYRPGFEALAARGFRRLDFEGLKPGSYGVDRTAVCYRARNCLGL